MTVSDCFSMAQLLAKGFLAGEYDEIRLAYTNFVSMLSQQPATPVPAAAGRIPAGNRAPGPAA